MKRLRPSRTKRAKMIIANQITKVIAPLTNAWLDFGTNDMMLPVSPPEMNVKSAGMIGSFRSWTLMIDSDAFSVVSELLKPHLTDESGDLSANALKDFRRFVNFSALFIFGLGIHSPLKENDFR